MNWRENITPEEQSIHVCCCEQSKARMMNGSWRPPSSNQPSAGHGSSPLFKNQCPQFIQETSKSDVQTWSAKLLLTLHHLVVFLGIFSVWRSLCSFFSSGSLGREMGALWWFGRTVFNIHNVLIAIQWTMWGLQIEEMQGLFKWHSI